jgi:hypothetical protein
MKSEYNERVAQKGLRGYNKSNWKSKKLRKIHPVRSERGVSLPTKIGKVRQLPNKTEEYLENPKISAVLSKGP